MNTEKPQSEPSTMSEAKGRQEANTGHSIEEGQHESITDHQTKALRRSIVGGDRATTQLYYRGPFRVYFNRKEEAPRVVSIDNGSHAWEIVCKTVAIARCDLKSRYEAGKEYPNPAFTLEGYGWVHVDANGNAAIS
jgi:hypothetical protein